MEEIDYLKKERNATILAHFYVDGIFRILPTSPVTA